MPDSLPTVLLLLLCSAGCGLEDITDGPVLHTGNGAFSIALVPAGYDDDGAWRADAAYYARAMEDDDSGIVGMAPQLFTLTRSEGIGRVAPFTVPDELGGRDLLAVDAAAVAALVGDVDVAIVVVHDLDGRPNAPPATRSTTVLQERSDAQPAVIELAADTPALVVISDTDGADVLQHELGHALVGLSDEYHDVDGCFPAPAFAASLDVLAPNLTLDASGIKWEGLVDATRSGGGRFSGCVFHPDAPCRMRDSAVERFCPVCHDAVDRLLRARAGDDERPPICALESTTDPRTDDNGMVVQMRVRDENRGISARLDLDGVPLVIARGDVSELSLGVGTSPPSPAGAHLLLTCSDAAGNTTTTPWDLAPTAR